MSIKASASVQAAAANSGAIYAQMLAGATKPINIRAITVVTRTGVATEIGLARSHSVGTASAGNVATGVAHRKQRQSEIVGSVEVAWATAPTGPTGAHSYLRREAVAGVTGTRIELWRPENGSISIEPTGATGMGLLLLNVGSGAGAALDIHIDWEFGPASDH